MKKITLFAILGLLACGNSRNELMTKLINEKKIVADSFSLCKENGKYYNDKYIYSDSAVDPKFPGKMLDSSTFFWGRAKILATRIDEINFSIDSLQKMR